MAADKPLDLTQGIPATALADEGMVAGRVGDADVVLIRRGDEYFAIGAECTHYHGPLAEGLVVGDTIRCPWHHACFDLRTGEAVRAPALDPIECWRVERTGDRIIVREKLSRNARRTPPSTPSSVLIVGGGAAGLAAADMLRREGYDGPLTMLSADAEPPCDRPNLSKDFLAGTAKEDWIPLRSSGYYKDNHIDLVLNARVDSIDTQAKSVRLDDGRTYEFGALLLATGAEPVALSIEGTPAVEVRYLRTVADSRAIIERAAAAKRVLVIGASFIGLEVAASLRARGLDVDVVAPEAQPLERVMGPEVGRFIRAVHEAHGVRFHLGATVTKFDDRTATLSDGTTIDADLVVAGVGVRPALGLAEQAGLTVDHGVVVDRFLRTSAPGVFAAGDIARWPDSHSGESIRVEHWVVAERQGQTAARNILGHEEPFDAVPFFWSQHYDVTIGYVGHADKWDRIAIDGDLSSQDATITYLRDGRPLAVAAIGRDRASLSAEAKMETSPAGT